MSDPFAAAMAPAQDEAQQQTETSGSPWDTPPPEAAKPAPVVKNVVQNDEGKVVLTFKGGTGFDAPWIVVHANDLDEALYYVGDEGGKKLIELMQGVQNAGKYFASQGGSAPSNGGGGGGGNRGRSNAPQGAKQPPPGVEPAPGPEYEYKSGTKNGKFWHGWFPPRNSGKDVVWLKSD